MKINLVLRHIREKRPVSCRPLILSLLLVAVAASSRPAAPQSSSITPAITFSTLFGGSASEDEINAVAIDSAGNVYITGSVGSTDLPVTPNAFQKTVDRHFRHVFVAKLNPQATAILYLTYLGGSKADEAGSIAVDATGNAYVVGTTLSSDFPVTPGAMQTIYGGTGGVLGDAFVAKLDPTGSHLLYSTFLGGNSDDAAQSIAVDAQGEAFITGNTRSGNFPVTASAYQQSYGGSGKVFGVVGGDAFVAKLDATGSRLVYSTFLGGGGEDAANAIALDSAGDAVIVGGTASSNFPTTANAVRRSYAGGSDALASTGDAFIAKLNPTGTGLLFSTYLGGSSGDAASAVSLDSAGNIYVQGNTTSANFPTAHALQAAIGGKTDAFLACLNPTGDTLIYSTYFGGNGTDYAFGIADAAGNVYFAGSSDSTNLPLLNSLQPYFGDTDAYLARIDPAGSALLYVTSLGGSDADSPNSIARDPFGNLWIAGSTYSQDYPIFNPIQSTAFHGDYTGFLTRIAEGPTPPANQSADIAVTFTSDRSSIVDNDTVHFTAVVTNNGPAAAANVIFRHHRDTSFALTFTGSSATATQGSCSGSNYITCSLGALNPGQQATVNFTATARPPAYTIQGPLTISVAAVSSNSDPNMKNNSSQVVISQSLKGINGDQPRDDTYGYSCFIATAAFGSYLDPHVQALRDFRDRHLLTNDAGRLFVRFYYRHSPPIAAVIGQHPALRALTRWLLSPIILLIEFPIVACAMLLLLLCAYVLYRKRRQKQEGWLSANL
jgi:hypothetical protein